LHFETTEGKPSPNFTIKDEEIPLPIPVSDPFARAVTKLGTSDGILGGLHTRDAGGGPLPAVRRFERQASSPGSVGGARASRAENRPAGADGVVQLHVANLRSSFEHRPEPNTSHFGRSGLARRDFMPAAAAAGAPLADVVGIGKMRSREMLRVYAMG
jgi:hypothetical protein